MLSTFKGLQPALLAPRQPLVQLPGPCDLLVARSTHFTARQTPKFNAQLNDAYGTVGLKKQPQEQLQQSCQQEGPQQLTQRLQQVLQLNTCKFNELIVRAPYILDFDPYTLSVTLEALCDALHCSHGAVVNVIEQRPAILLAPYEPTQVLQQLAAVLGVSRRRAAMSMSKHMQLLALTPKQLQQRLRHLCSIMHWPAEDPHAAAATAGSPAFLQLLSADPLQTKQQLKAIAQALGVDDAYVAAVAQHFPRQLLQRRDAAAAISPQLQLLSETAGMSISELLQGLDSEQNQGLAGLLLYESSWLRQQLRSLDFLTEKLLGRKLPNQVLVWLLLRLGTPNMFSSLHRRSETSGLAAALKQVVARNQAWEQQLQVATDRELAVLLSADATAIQRALFLASTGKAHDCGLSLWGAVCCSQEEFVCRYGKQEFEE